MVAFRAFRGRSVFAEIDKLRNFVNDSQTTMKILEDVGDEKRERRKLSGVGSNGF